MAKNVISQSDELIKLRSRLRRENVFQSLGVALLVLVLFGIYVLLSALGNGYYGLSGPFGSVGALSWARYFDMAGQGLFDVKSGNNNYLRLIVLGGVILVAVFCGFIYSRFSLKKKNKYYKSMYLKYLLDEVKFNGVSLDIKEDMGKDSDLEYVNIADAKPFAGLTFSTPLLSWEGREYEYRRDNESRKGFLISMDMTKARSHAFIQLRSFGQPSIQQYDGLPIKAYGFGEDVNLNSFICYTTLGSDIYLVFDKKTAVSVNDFYKFAKCDMAITVIGDRLSIFLEGFHLELTHGIKKKLPENVLEKEAEALVAIHQAISNLAMAVSGDTGFAEEGQGNGILPY